MNLSQSAPIDPVCIFHGKRRSEHVCIVCCLCWKDLTPDECATIDGQKTDVCVPCAEEEARFGRTDSTVSTEENHPNQEDLP